jgi:hypothetical protein
VRFKTCIEIGIIAGLCACAGEPTGPYWDNAAWMRDFQQSFHLSYPTPMIVNAGIKKYTATVDISYSDGKFKSVSIVKSTGLDDMDKYIVAQIRNTRMPIAAGPQRLDPHSFQINVVMDPGIKDFEVAMKQYISKQTIAALHGDWAGDYGYVIAQFDYVDGKISNATIIYNDTFKKLGQDVVAKILQVHPPEAIPAIAGQEFRFIVGFCFMNQVSDCPVLEKQAYKALH